MDKLNKQIQEGKTGVAVINRHQAGPDLVSIIDPGDYQLLNEQVKETHKTLEESERIINGLKDQTTELKFQLTQKQSEITSLQSKFETFRSLVFRNKRQESQLKMLWRSASKFTI